MLVRAIGVYGPVNTTGRAIDDPAWANPSSPGTLTFSAPGGGAAPAAKVLTVGVTGTVLVAVAGSSLGIDAALLSDDDPEALYTTDVSVTPGTAPTAARSDHQHKISVAGSAAGISTVTPGNAAFLGTSEFASRHDHVHAVLAGAAQGLTDSTNFDGDDNTVSIGNHTHGHGNRGGGSLHANVVAAGAAGFMTGADKTKLDALESAVSIVDDTSAPATGDVIYVSSSNKVSKADAKAAVAKFPVGVRGFTTASVNRHNSITVNKHTGNAISAGEPVWLCSSDVADHGAGSAGKVSAVQPTSTGSINYIVGIAEADAVMGATSVSIIPHWQYLSTN